MSECRQRLIQSMGDQSSISRDQCDHSWWIRHQTDPSFGDRPTLLGDLSPRWRAFLLRRCNCAARRERGGSSWSKGRKSLSSRFVMHSQNARDNKLAADIGLRCLSLLLALRLRILALWDSRSPHIHNPDKAGARVAVNRCCCRCT